ncbi:MAG TPA: type II toxin-antitoxin system RelE/ParE family toxin [Verrucomicrobiae bacterium]
MSARKSGDFIADMERQFEWYAVNADWNIAERYLAAVEAACQLLAKHPLLGRSRDFLIRVCATGDSSPSFVRFKSTSSFTKFLGVEPPETN